MCINDTDQITDISTLQLIHKLLNFIHIINMQSNGAIITLSSFGSCSGWICQQIRFWPDFNISQSCMSLQFLANVNSSSRSLFVIVRPSVCRL